VTARFDGLPPIQLVEDWDDPAIRAEPVPAKGWPSGQEQPRRYLGGTNDYTGGLFVLRRRDGAWRVTDQARYWVA
jgi:hypothetical protein